MGKTAPALAALLLLVACAKSPVTPVTPPPPPPPVVTPPPPPPPVPPPPPPPHSRPVTATWTAPTENTDSSPVSAQLYFIASDGTDTVTTVGMEATFDLMPGTYDFSVRACYSISDANTCGVPTTLRATIN